MESIIDLLKVASTLSPIAVIGLLATGIILLIKNQRSVTDIQTNHLHAMPDIEAGIGRLEDTMEAWTQESRQKHDQTIQLLTRIVAILDRRSSPR